jgi:hypothetical protein
MLKNGNDFTAAACMVAYTHSPGVQAMPYNVIATERCKRSEEFCFTCSQYGSDTLKIII